MQLLPAASEQLPCAQFAENIGLSPAGTGLHVDGVVLVEVALPWPKPVFEHPMLAGLAGTMPLGSGSARVLATEPRDPSKRRVIVWRRESDGVRAELFETTDPVGVVQALGDENPPVGDKLDPRAVLVCTQGSHDACCGTRGDQFATAYSQIADIPVFRVSHTGGHRFAPTAMTLPEGRMWGGVNAEELHAAQLSGDTSTLAASCRGWWGAGRGPAQTAEAAVFAAVGDEFAVPDRTVTVREEPPDPETGLGRWTATVVAGENRWQVPVAVTRLVPTIACESAGGKPAKIAHEYQAGTVTRVD